MGVKNNYTTSDLITFQCVSCSLATGKQRVRDWNEHIKKKRRTAPFKFIVLIYELPKLRALKDESSFKLCGSISLLWTSNKNSMSCSDRVHICLYNNNIIPDILICNNITLSFTFLWHITCFYRWFHCRARINSTHTIVELYSTKWLWQVSYHVCAAAQAL